MEEAVVVGRARLQSDQTFSHVEPRRKPPARQGKGHELKGKVFIRYQIDSVQVLNISGGGGGPTKLENRGFETFCALPPPQETVKLVPPPPFKEWKLFAPPLQYG